MYCMEIILDELKQFDLKKINYIELKVNNYYLGYNYKKSIELFYLDYGYFDDGVIDLLWSDEFDEIYEFSFGKNIINIILNSFSHVCENLKNNEQTIDIITKKEKKYICLKFSYGLWKKPKTISIYYSNDLFMETKIEIFKNFVELNEKINIFINEIKGGKCFDNSIAFYHE